MVSLDVIPHLSAQLRLTLGVPRPFWMELLLFPMSLETQRIKSLEGKAFGKKVPKKHHRGKTGKYLQNPILEQGKYP